MRAVLSVLLVLPVVVFCCDESTEYEKDGQCCKMCGPGTRLMQTANCNDPYCQPCEEGEYQSSYTKDTKCKRQPSCDKNLNFIVPSERSKKELQSCQCLSGHHCSSGDCVSCVRNTICQPGEKIVKEGTMNSDTTCQACPNGTYSNAASAKACQPWTECPSGYVETTQGSSTSDRICEAQSNIRLGIWIFASVFVILLILAGAFIFYKKGRTGSVCLEKKLQQHCPALFKTTNDNHQPTVLVNVEDVPLNPQQNEPEEDTDTTKNEDPIKYGLSANGMPIDQDHSKVSVVSQPETNPSEQSFTVNF